MYYSLTYQSQQRLFTTAEEAWHRLRAGQVWLQMHDCILIDYLLVPHSMHCIVQGRLRMGASKFLHISPLTNEQLLIVFGELGKLGKEYHFVNPCTKVRQKGRNYSRPSASIISSCKTISRPSCGRNR